MLKISMAFCAWMLLAIYNAPPHNTQEYYKRFSVRNQQLTLFFARRNTMLGNPVKIKVRGYHLDIYGHVNNARYLEFLEEARWSYFEQHNTLEVFAERQLAFVLVNINISYRRPGFPDDVLEIHTHIQKVGNKSCVIEQEIFLENSDTLIADATVTFALMDMNTNKAIEIRGDIRHKLESLVP